MERKKLATDLASALAGWFQLMIVQRLGGLSGEDSARLLVCQVINAQGRYITATSQLPTNWARTKKRIDVAIQARLTVAQNWYGAIELKWPGDSFDVGQTRLQILQDAMRLSFVQTANLGARFLIVGATDSSLQRIFVSANRNAVLEAQRVALGTLLRTNMSSPDGELDHATWSAVFPKAGDRVPAQVFGTFAGKLKSELLATADARVGSVTAGHVYVWQCNRTRGRVQVAGAANPGAAQ